MCAPYRIRTKALDILGVDHKASYNKLERYALAINQINLGSIVDLHITCGLGDMNPICKRFFISFDAQRKCFFKDCKPFIILDSCHLIGLFK